MKKKERKTILKKEYKWYQNISKINLLETDKKNNIKQFFSKYISDQKIKRGIKDQTLFQGILRINPRNPRHAYVSCEGIKQDVFLPDLKHRNRSQQGDWVILKLEPIYKWRNIISSNASILDHRIEKNFDNENSVTNECSIETSEDSKENKFIYPIIFVLNLKSWIHENFLKLNEVLMNLEKYFPIFKKKININSVSFTCSNTRKSLIDCRCDFLFILFPFIKFQTFFQENETYINFQIFRNIFKRMHEFPKLLIIHSSNALKICEISKKCGISFSISINSHSHNNSTKVFIENIIKLIIEKKKNCRNCI